MKEIYLKIIEYYLLNKIDDSIFLAEKLKTLLDNDIVSIYILANCYFLKSEYVKVNYIL